MAAGGPPPCLLLVGTPDGASALQKEQDELKHMCACLFTARQRGPAASALARQRYSPLSAGILPTSRLSPSRSLEVWSLEGFCKSDRAQGGHRSSQIRLVRPELRGDAATKHLVANKKPLTYTILSKITRPLDPHFGGQGGSLSAISAMGAMGLRWGTRRNCYSLESSGGPQGDGSSFQITSLSALSLPSPPPRAVLDPNDTIHPPKMTKVPLPEHGQVELPLPDGGMGRGRWSHERGSP